MVNTVTGIRPVVREAMQLCSEIRMSGERLCEPVGAAWTGPGRENAAAHGVPAPWGRVICERTRRPCANRRIGVSRDRGSLGMDR